MRDTTLQQLLPTYAIATALVRCGDSFLIAKRSSKKKFAPNTWEFPSGFLDKSMPVEQLILEELDEEFLIREGKILKRGNPFVVRDTEANWIVIPFLIDVPIKVAVLHPDEHSELKWVTREEIYTFPDLTDLLPILTLLGK